MLKSRKDEMLGRGSGAGFEPTKRTDRHLRFLSFRVLAQGNHAQAVMMRLPKIRMIMIKKGPPREEVVLGASGDGGGSCELKF